MFKLIKIMNSGKSVPELVKLKGNINTTYRAGCVYFINDCGIIINPSLDDDHKFIPIKTTTIDEKNTTVTGYIVSEEMLFETKHPDINEKLQVGNSYTFLRDSDGVASGISEITGGDMKVISIDSVDTTGKVNVVLKW